MRPQSYKIDFPAIDIKPIAHKLFLAYYSRKEEIVAKEDSLFSRGTGLREKEREALKEPDMYRVVLHNDDYTTREFVVSVIMAVFHKTAAEATRIMLDVHRKGRGTVGVYVYDIAETKARRVKELADAEEFPLKCTVEKV